MESDAKTKIHLKEREVEVIELLFQGYSNDAIEEELSLGHRTLAKTLGQVYSKFRLPERAYSGRNVRVMAAVIWSKIRTQYIS
jgi:ATP/maltotriose-dependent transcriptional regulator MalT